jgi:hypothetical protein
MTATASNADIRETLAGRPQRPAVDDPDAKTYTVIGVHDPEHPDYDGTGWRIVVCAHNPTDAEGLARAEASGCVYNETPDDEWVDRMDRTHVVAIVEGDQRVTLQDPVSGEYDRHVG